MESFIGLEGAAKRFEFHFKKPYDGRYHTAKMLHDMAERERGCHKCWRAWYDCYAHKCTLYYNFKEIEFLDLPKNSDNVEVVRKKILAIKDMNQKQYVKQLVVKELVQHYCRLYTNKS